MDVPAPGCCALLLPDTGETVADVREARSPAGPLYVLAYFLVGEVEWAVSRLVVTFPAA